MIPLFMKRSCLLLGLLLFLAGPLLSCRREQPDQTTGTTRQTTTQSETKLTETDATAETDPTPLPEPPTPVPQPPLLDLADVGKLESGHTLLLPGGKWYDASQQDHLIQVSKLTVEASGTGRPTISRSEEAKPVLTISDSDQITFKNIRFGYAKADYRGGTPIGDIPLLKISNSRNIHFENCEFFGGAAAAVYLDNVQNISFTDCQFYNNAGLPLQTDLTAVPSQASFKNCSFETIDSGLMPLNLSRSSFEGCSFIGRDGYRVPVAATRCPVSDAQDSDLHQQLEGILAGRVSYFRDENQALTIRQSLFCSVDVYVLYDDLLQTVKQVLPQGWYNMALAGEKDGEQLPGRPLDPTLGLRIDLRTQTDDGFYDLDMLIDDLQPLAQIPDLLEQLPGGQIRIRLFDQRNQPLLTGEMAIRKIEALLQSRDAGYWLSEAVWRLWQTHLAAGDFSDLPLGRITPGIASMVLENAWQQNKQPLLIAENSDSGRYIMIQPQLSFRGTRLSSDAAVHQYQLSIERRTSADQNDCLIRIPVADIEYQAGNGAKTDFSQRSTQRFTLPDNQLRLLIAPLLSEPLQITLEAEHIESSPYSELSAGEIIQLSLLAQDDEITWAASPILIYRKVEQQIVLKTVLYDQDVRPWLVQIVLSGSDEDQWQIEQTELITG